MTNKYFTIVKKHTRHYTGLWGNRLMGAWVYRMKFTHHWKSQKKHTRNFRFCSIWPVRFTGLWGYGIERLRSHSVKALHVLGLIWLWGYRYIEFSEFSKCFLRLGRNPDVLGSNELRIRFQRENIFGNIIEAFFAQTIFYCGPVL